MKPYIIKEKCPAQGAICRAIKACPSGAITYVEDEAELLGGRIEINYSKCTGCGICAQECCGAAIEMRENEAAPASSPSASNASACCNSLCSCADGCCA